MALIKKENLDKINKTRNNIHKKVYATYTIFEENGEKYFQIDTYGSEERVMKEKISQSIQIDKETAEYLVDLLKKEFIID